MEKFDNMVNKYEIEAYEKLSMKLHLPLNHSRSRKPRRHLVTTELGRLAQQKFYAFVCNAYMSLVVRKPAFCICENKDADQLRSNCAADQRLCFRYTDSTISLLPKSEISSI